MVVVVRVGRQWHERLVVAAQVCKHFSEVRASIFNIPYLPKKGPWAEHLTSPQKRGVGALSTVSAFNHERAPTSCLQRDLKPSKQIIGHKIKYNGITRGFEVESWWHTTLWTARWDAGEHCVARGAHRISYVLLRKDALHWFDTNSARGRASQTPHEVCSRVGAHSSKLWPYTRIWAKSRGWALFRE